MKTNKQYRATLALLIEKLGGDAIVQMRAPLPRSTRETVGYRAAVDDQIHGCTACALHVDCRQPVAPWWGRLSDERECSVAVVCDHPSEAEDKAGELGHGRVAQMLRFELGKAGVGAFTMLNAVQCATESRKPTRDEQATCRAHALAAIDAADVQYVLLFGVDACRLWRSDVLLGDVAGGAFLWQQRWMVTPMYHPKALMRKDAAMELTEWRQHLRRFAEVVASRHTLEALGVACVACKAEMFGHDEDGVPWCRTHFTARAKVPRQEKKTVNTRQGSIL